MKSAIRRGWQNILDFLLPRHCCGCGERISPSEVVACRPCMESIQPLHLPICVRCGSPDARIKEPGRCENCPPGTVWFTRARGTAPYHGISQTLVYRLKYRQRLEYAPVMGEAMVKLLQQELAQRAQAAPPPESSDSVRALPDVIVPVPLHAARYRERGFNQAEILGRYLSQHLEIPAAPRALKRTRPTPTQTSLKRRARRENVKGAFKCQQPAAIAGKHVLLVDDVYTTGSTINECARMLIQAGATSVECIAYARAVLD